MIATPVTRGVKEMRGSCKRVIFIEIHVGLKIPVEGLQTPGESRGKRGGSVAAVAEHWSEGWVVWIVDLSEP